VRSRAPGSRWIIKIANKDASPFIHFDQRVKCNAMCGASPSNPASQPATPRQSAEPQRIALCGVACVTGRAGGRDVINWPPGAPNPTPQAFGGHRGFF
jgi:hypothetical protein